MSPAPRTTPIRAITFDFWDTLYVAHSAAPLRQQRLTEMLSPWGITPEQAREATHQAWQAWDRVWRQEQRTFGGPTWVSLALEHLGIEVSPAEFDALVEAMVTASLVVRPRPVDGASALLARLAPCYKLGLISDTGLTAGPALRRLMEEDGLAAYFTHMTFSDELGCSKPHPRAFLATLEHLGVPPEQAVHVGDWPRTDVAGAQGVGMRAVRFQGVVDRRDDTVSADATIDSLSELERILERWQE